MLSESVNCVMHWTRLRETEHSSWHNKEAVLIFYRTFAAPLTGSTTLISSRDLNLFKSPNAISTWLSMVRHEFHFCHATFQSAPWRPAVEPWTDIWSWGSFSWCKNTRIHSWYMHTHLLSKVECVFCMQNTRIHFTPWRITHCFEPWMA